MPSTELGNSGSPQSLDDGARMADSLAFFGVRIDLGVGCVAEEHRHVAVFQERDDILVFGFEFAALIERVVTDLERFFPAERRR